MRFKSPEIHYVSLTMNIQFLISGCLSGYILILYISFYIW